MDKTTKAKYLKAFIELTNTWLNECQSLECDYLLSRVPKDKANFFLFGYFPTDISKVIKDFGDLIQEDPIPILRDCNIIYITEKYNKIVPFFKSHNLLIPFFDVHGDPISIVGRTILSQEQQKEQNISKYKHIPFKKRKHLYGLNWSYENIVKKDYAVIVEGQFDFISGAINGINNIVALGGSKFTFEHVALLKRFTNNFYVLLDNDEAGESGLESIKKNATKFGLKINKLALPDDSKDLDEYLKKNKMKDIREFVMK